MRREGIGEGPERIGPYHLVRVIGRGGFGEVHEARHEVTGERVALKLLTGVPGPELARFHREALVLRKIEHPNVVRSVGSDMQGNPPYLAMEYLEGDNLKDLLARIPASRLGTLPYFAGVLSLARDLAYGLAAIHRAGILHRDLKPANVILVTHGRAVILDMGLARETGDSVTSLTATGAMLGTLMYMAPEQVQGEPATKSTDTYQWGLIVHELLTGQLPFPGGDPWIRVQQRMTEPITLPPIPLAPLKRLGTLVESCLGPRVADGEALARELDRVLEAPATGGALPEVIEPTTRVAMPAYGFLLETYDVLRVLGKGGMGSVHEAVNRRSGERLAIKILEERLDAAILDRFHREVAMMAAFISPRIVRILDHGVREGRGFIVMEYLEGETLQARLRRELSLPPEEVLHLMLALAEGLAELHARGIIHRDIKPANLMCVSRKGLKLLDLGIADAIDPSGTAPTADRPGTFGYAAPEWFGHAPLAPAADVFAAGLIMHEALTGRRDARGSGAADALRGHLFLRNELVSGPGRELVQEIVETFVTMVDPDPARRMPDGKSLLARFRRLVSGGDRLLTRPKNAPPGALEKPPGSASPPGAILMAGRRFIDFLVVALVLGVVAGTLWILPQLQARGAP